MARPEHQAAASARFATTRWSVVLSAKDPGEPLARESLAQLCADYWQPVYWYVRRSGFATDLAEDQTQDFFARLLEKNLLAGVEPHKGKFRTFLLACLRNFLANERDRASAKRRGGGRLPLSLDFARAEQAYSLEPHHVLTPEKLFERRWAIALLDGVLQQLRREYESSDRGPLFEKLGPFLTADGVESSYVQAAESLSMTPGAVKVAIHRLRRRYRELLREEIGRTVDDPSEVDDEIRGLFAALG